ncbi:hypothetical protein QW180_02540 [Vibrio sinaloensis]|nr:hypothetical protein [Vibrio sinaloensis]
MRAGEQTAGVIGTTIPKTWSHMDDDYPYRLEQAERADPKFKDAWKYAPISLETCTTPGEWKSIQNYSLAEVKSEFGLGAR